MVTLLADVHFWTFRDDVIVQDPDIGAYRYQEKGAVQKERLYYNQRKTFIESRLGTVLPKNTRPGRLRDTLKELDEILVKEKLVVAEWISSNTFELIFSSGVIGFLYIDASTGELTSVIIDRFLQGKLLSENVTSVLHSSRFIVFAYNDSKASVVDLGKNSVPRSERSSMRLSSLDVNVSTCPGIGPPGRRFERQLSINNKENMVLVWWKTTEDEVYPWSPLDKERDRANIIVYKWVSGSLQLLHYCRTEMAPLSVKFSKHNSNTILTVEQGFDQKGDVIILNSVYEVQDSCLVRISTVNIPLEAPLAAHAHNPQETALLMACNNGVLALHSETKGTTHLTKAGLIPVDISWLESGTLVLVSNDRGQMQCFDMALSLIRLQLQLDDHNPVRILDLSEYFSQNQYLSRISWGPCDNYGSPCIPPIFIYFTNGPIGCLRIGTAECFTEGDVLKLVYLTQYTLTRQYIKHNQYDEAINLLVSINWQTDGLVAMKCLSLIVSSLLKLPLTPERESQLETAIATFYVPSVPFNEQIEEEFNPNVRALTRRFFFKVLRKGSVEKAYRLALDLKDYDCFLNVHHVASIIDEKQIAALALENARDIESGSCHSDCSSLCSHQSGSDSSHSELCSTCSSLPEQEADSNEIGYQKYDEPSKISGNPTTPGIVINVRQPHNTESHVGFNRKAPPKPQRKISQLHPEATNKTGTIKNAGVPPDHVSLLQEYEQTVCHEVTTEEEDGGTVKVVHFGVV